MQREIGQGTTKNNMLEISNENRKIHNTKDAGEDNKKKKKTEEYIEYSTVFLVPNNFLLLFSLML